MRSPAEEPAWEDPAWNRLPHDPQGFFELDSDYGRKDLKRSYNRLLRRFKPEKYPVEFRRIRDAYEQLDNQIRYGARFSQPAVEFEKYSWSVPEVSESSRTPAERQTSRTRTPARQRTDRPVARPLHERLAKEPVKKLYAELAALPEKQPYHYFALAVLADGLEPPDPQRFVKWLLTGLRDSSDDPALFQLLYAYVRNSVADNQIAGLLKAVSQVIRDDRFYFVTEPLWDRLLKIVSFPKFRRILSRCEADISDIQMVRKLTFYIHILKGAMWSADAEWTEEAFGIIDEHYQELPPFLEYDVELLFHLREYLQVRDEFLAVHPLRRLADRTIETCCTADAVEAERTFVGCQVRLTGVGRDLLDAFPCLDDSPALNTFTALWHLVGIEYSDRFVQPADESNEGSLRIWPVLLELEAKTDRTSLGRIWNWSMYGYRFGSLLIYPLIFMICYLPLSWGLSLAPGSNFLWILCCLAIAGVGGWCFDRYVAQRLWSKWCYHMAEKCYRSVWRKELQQIMSRTFISYVDLINRIHSADDFRGQLTCQSWLLVFAGHDPALEIYSGAQQFVA